MDLPDPDGYDSEENDDELAQFDYDGMYHHLYLYIFVSTYIVEISFFFKRRCSTTIILEIYNIICL